MLLPVQTICYPIRRVEQREAACLMAFVCRQDAPALQSRFGRFMTPDLVREHYRRFDWENAVVLAWHAADGICAVAEVILHAGPDGRQAEIALCVARAWHGRGIAELMLRQAAAAAAHRGALRSLVVLTHGDCTGGIVLELGGTIDAESGIATLMHRPAR